MPNTVGGAVDKKKKKNMKTCPLALKNFQSNRERILQNKPEASYSHICFN